MFVLNENVRMLLLIFSIIAVGYFIGRIRIGGISLGTAGIFMAGLIFGHFGANIPSVLQNMGLVLFITSVGFSSGPGFMARLKKNGMAYLVLCLTTTMAGGVLCFLSIRLLKIDGPLAIGILTGAYTTSPGFAAAKEAVSVSAAGQVAAGYGIAYPVGVICKVMFIQFIPKILHVDMLEERKQITWAEKDIDRKQKKGIFRVDKYGFLPIAVAGVIGLCIGTIRIPLPEGGHFSLGSTGGALIASLFLGALAKFGPLDLRVSKELTGTMKEFGVVLFFVGAGVEGGHGIVEILTGYGVLPLLIGMIFVLIPQVAGFLMFRYVLKLPLLNGLGAMTASMTSTPSLAVLVELAGTDDVVAAYATTYPIALVMVILVIQVLSGL